MKIELEIQPPMMPNYLRYKQNPRPRQEGFKEAAGIAVADLTREQAEQAADMMRAAFIEHWENKQVKP